MKRLLFLVLGLALLVYSGCAKAPAPVPTTEAAAVVTTAEAASTTQYVAKITEKEALRLVNLNGNFSFDYATLKQMRLPYQGMLWAIENDFGCLSCSSEPNLDANDNWVYTVILWEKIYLPHPDGTEELHHITVNSKCYVNADTGEITDGWWPIGGFPDN